MPNLFGTPSDEPAQSNGAATLEAINALYDLEMRANITALRQQQRRARVQRSVAQWVEFWPVGVGILISLVAPQLREFVEAYRPWGLWLSFPMVALSIRPEVHMGSTMAAYLPTALVYLQFPLEGLLAKMALKGHVTVHGVIVQVVFFHGLCIIDLWLLGGGLWQMLHMFGH
jgi:hypothetical protein